MIKIAVVDDDELICKEIVRLISKFKETLIKSSH